VDLMLGSTHLLVHELTGRAAGWDIPTIALGIERWAGVWPMLDDRRSDVLPEEVLPGWARALLPRMQDRHPALLQAAAGENLVHNDLRNDNMILGADGSLTLVDWGMSRRGAAWVDPLVLLLEWVDEDTFDDLVHESPGLVQQLGDELVTTFLFTLAVWLADRSVTATNTGLPTLKAFRRRAAGRLLVGVRRRLAHDLGRSRPR
jgi:aminoglycoside phosphotransferase (APT) family kinase protein